MSTSLDQAYLWSAWEMWCDTPHLPSRDAKKAKQPSAVATPQSGQPNHASSWFDSLRSIGVFETIAGFWALHNCLAEPSQLPVGTNIYLFRRNIAPMWEHEANRRGGKWIVNLAIPQSQSTPGRHTERTPQRSQSSNMNSDEADRAWLLLCLSAIGEQFPGHEEELCGVVLNKRKAVFRLSVWTRNAIDRSQQERIGAYIKKRLDLDSRSITYVPHAEVLSCSAQAKAVATRVAEEERSPPASPLSRQGLTTVPPNVPSGKQSDLFKTPVQGHRPEEPHPDSDPSTCKKDLFGKDEENITPTRPMPESSTLTRSPLTPNPAAPFTYTI